MRLTTRKYGMKEHTRRWSKKEDTHSSSDMLVHYDPEHHVLFVANNLIQVVLFCCINSLMAVILA